MSRIPDSSDASQILVRKARPDDAVELRVIAESSGIDAWTIEQYCQETRSDKAIAYVSTAGDAILGFILGGTIPGSVAAAEGEIYNIAVIARARRQGIGGTLLAAAVEAFRSDGCNCVWLEVRASNRRAVQFYENNGFRSFSIRRKFYSNPVEDAFVMRLPLIDATGD